MIKRYWDAVPGWVLLLIAASIWIVGNYGIQHYLIP